MASSLTPDIFSSWWMYVLSPQALNYRQLHVYVHQRDAKGQRTVPDSLLPGLDRKQGRDGRMEAAKGIQYRPSHCIALFLKYKLKQCTIFVYAQFLFFALGNLTFTVCFFFTSADSYLVFWMAFLSVVALLLFSHDHDNLILSETHSEARMRRQYMSSFYAVLVFSACFVQGYSLPQNRSDGFH